MNFLTDKDIIKWNDRITGYNTKAIYTTSYRKPVIVIVKSYQDPIYNTKVNFNSCSNIIISEDIFQEYETSFSIKKSDENIFNEIFRNLLKIEFETFIDTNKNPVYDESTFMKIMVDKDIKISENKEEHSIIDDVYVKYTYKYKGRLSSIMANVSCLEDSIEYFKLVSMVDETGKSSIKYKKGCIVSKPENKSRDWLVEEYVFSKDENSNYNLKFKIIEILNLKSSIIEYGETLVVNDNEICYSRNDRINNILSK